MKVIDFEKKGNVIRLYLGEDNLTDYHGDDWNDVSYENNAEKVYDEYISEIIDFAIPYNFTVIEPADDWKYNGNSPYCKDDFKNNEAPCLIIGNDEEYYDLSFMHNQASKNIYKIYFNDSIESIKELINSVNGIILNDSKLIGE